MMTNEKEFRLYTLEEVANIFKVPVRSIYYYIQTGKLDAVKVGKHWRVPESAVKDFIK